MRKFKSAMFAAIVLGPFVFGNAAPATASVALPTASTPSLIRDVIPCATARTDNPATLARGAWVFNHSARAVIAHETCGNRPDAFWQGDQRVEAHSNYYSTQTGGAPARCT